MKNHPEHTNSRLAKICGCSSHSSPWFHFPGGACVCFLSASPLSHALFLFLCFWILLQAQPCQKPGLGKLLTLRLLTTFWHFLWACSLLPSVLSWLYLEDFGAESVFFYCVSVQHFVQQHPDLSPGFPAVPQLNSLILKQGTGGALNGTIQSPGLSRWINMDMIRGCLMEAETFHLLKPFQQEKIISMQFSLWPALLWLEDQLFKKLRLCPKSCHIKPQPTVYFYKHIINLLEWPVFLTGTLPHFHSPWELKAHSTPSTALFPAAKLAGRFEWCPGGGSPFPNPPAELQASAPELSPLANSASLCHCSVLV